MPDPQNAYLFSVEIDGLIDAQFTECSGFEMKIDVQEYKEGGLNDYVHKLPGRVSYNNITLKRGMANTNELYAWLQRLSTAGAKRDEKKNISIILHTADHLTLSMRWDLTNAYPIKWTSPTIQSGASQVMIETLELTYDEFTMKKY